VDLKDIDAIYNKAIELFHDNSQKQPFASIPYNMFWDYFYNVETKTEQEFAEFAAYAAARSIVGRKLYCKTNDKLLFSRMSGFGGIHSFPKPYTKNGKSHWRISGIDKYCTRKRMERLRMAIATKFGVTVYSSMGIRGFYLSFKFNYEQIIVDIAKNSKTVFKTKQDYRERIKRAEQIALKNNTS
jgi:hypothetical protein